MAGTLFDFGIGLDTSGADKAIDAFAKKASKDIDDVIDSVDDISTAFAGIKIPTAGVDKLGQSFEKSSRLAKKSIDEQKKALAQLLVNGQKASKEFETLEADLKANIIEANKLEKALNEIDGTYSVNVDMDIHDESSKIDKLTGSLGGLMKGALVGGGVALIGAGLAKIGEVGIEASQAMAKLSSTTGKTGEEADKLRTVAENLFVQGFGDDLGGAIESVGKMSQALGDLATPEELEKIAPIFAGIAKSTGQDIDEITAKSRTFIQNYKGDVVDAVNTISAVSQLGANAQQDTFDTLDEYSNLAMDAGFSMQQFSSFLIAGVQAGARDTDKLADSLKEANIRIKAGDYGTAFEALGKGASSAEKVYIDKINSILKKAEDGSIDISQALGLSGDEIQKGVDAGVISEALQAKLATAVAGTPAEDIGAGLFNKLLSGLNDPDAEKTLSESAKKAAELYGTVFAGSGQGFEGLQRTLTVLAGDLGDLLLPVLNLVSSLLKDVLKDVSPLVNELIGSLLPIISSIMEILTPIIKSVSDLLLPVITKVVGVVAKLAEALVPIVNGLLPPLFDVLITIADATLQVFDAFEPLIDVILEGIIDLMPEITLMLTSFADIIKTTLPIALNVLIPIITFFINRLSDVYETVFDVAKAVGHFGAVIYSTLVEAFKSVSKFVSEVVEKLGKFLGIANESSKGAKKLADSMNKAGEATQSMSKEAQKYGLSIKEYKDALDKATKQGITIEQVLKNQADAHAKAANQVRGHGSALAGTSDATKKLAQESLDYEKRLKALNKAGEDVAVSFGGIKKSMDFGGGGFADMKLPDFDQAQLDYYKELGKINVDDFVESLIKLSEVDLDGFASSIKKVDFSKLSSNLADLKGDELKEFAYVIGGIGQGLGDSLFEIGKNTKDGLKSFAISALDGLQGLIPIVIATLYAKEVLSKSIAGFAIATAGAAVLYALLESAKQGVASIGAEEGGHITAGYNKKAGATDTIPIMLAPNEYVVNAKSVQEGNNLEILEAMNAGKDVSTMFVGTNGKLGDVLNNITVATGQIYGNVPTNATAGDSVLNRDVLKRLESIDSNIRSQEVSIVDRGRVDIHDNRTIFKKQSVYR